MPLTNSTLNAYRLQARLSDLVRRFRRLKNNSEGDAQCIAISPMTNRNGRVASGRMVEAMSGHLKAVFFGLENVNPPCCATECARMIGLVLECDAGD